MTNMSSHAEWYIALKASQSNIQYMIINQMQCSSFFVVFLMHTSNWTKIRLPDHQLYKHRLKTNNTVHVGCIQSYSLCVIKIEKGPWNLKQRIGKGIDKYIPRTCLFLLLGLSTLQKKALSNQNKGHLGSRYICLVMICCCPLQYLMVIPCSPY